MRAQPSNKCPQKIKKKIWSSCSQHMHLHPENHNAILSSDIVIKFSQPENVRSLASKILSNIETLDFHKKIISSTMNVIHNK